MLHLVAKSSERWQRNSVKIIAVQVEKDPELFSQEATKKKKEHYTSWEFCFDDGSGNGPIFSQVPAPKNGRVVLLDRQHQIYDVNVSAGEIVTSVKKVLAIRNSETE